MISLDRPVIVEGKYDKIKLSSIIDSIIITTDGFAIFKDKEKVNLIKKLAAQNGIIVMTDSDSAGMLIRSFLKGVIPSESITHVYIPELLGKEKRKVSFSSEGLLGVEGVDKEIIFSALERAGVTGDLIQKGPNKRFISKTDLFELGLTGGENSREKRIKLLKYLEFPTKMSTNALLQVLNDLIGYEKLVAILEMTGE